MANVSKDYGVDDVVYVWFSGSIANYWIPVSKTVKRVDVNSATNEALVTFTDGTTVIDGAIPTVFTTQALCATAIVTDVISKSASSVALDVTVSVASTVSQPSITLGRIG